MKRVQEMLAEAARVYEERNAMYGNNYITFGGNMYSLLGMQPIELKSDLDHSRFAILVQIVSKLTRYVSRFEAGGHPDSLLDLAVYSQMLRELDEIEGAQAFERSTKEPELPFDSGWQRDSNEAPFNRL